MESLKIKCPSCGIILEVTNSRNEAVKRIVCPYCKKTLAITFRIETKPAQEIVMAALPALYYGQMRIALQEGQNQIPLPDAECFTVRVVRLKDGNCKCLVSTKQENAVRLNDEYLLLGDEVALSDGDLLRFGNTVLSFNKPVEDKIEPPKPKLPPKKKPWWIAVAASIVAIALITAFWPKEKKIVEEHPSITKEEKKDPPPQKSGTTGTTTSGGNRDKGNNIVDRIEKPASINYDGIGDFDLEKLALKGDVVAQYKLGKRWTKTKDSTNIVKGSNYLKLASRNGSEEASRALQSVKSTLRDAADRGNTHADNLLRVINSEQ